MSLPLVSLVRCLVLVCQRDTDTTLLFVSVAVGLFPGITGTPVKWSNTVFPPVWSSQIPSPNQGRDFESVELEEMDQREKQREKPPRRIIHFSSGETMEEYSTDEEEEEEEDKEPERKDLLSSPVDAVRVRKISGDKHCGCLIVLLTVYVF